VGGRLPAAQRWINDGVFEAMARGLQAILRIAAGREANQTAIVIDSRASEGGHRGAHDEAKRRKG
jgi:hypothetical protein